MELKKIANWVMDELFPAMDADDSVPSQGSSPTDPPDLVAHDKKYHKGHWDGKSKCKYREDREAALAGVSGEKEQQDIIDRLNPEDVDGEEIDKADDLSVADNDSVSIYTQDGHVYAKGSYKGNKIDRIFGSQYSEEDVNRLIKRWKSYIELEMPSVSEAELEAEMLADSVANPFSSQFKINKEKVDDKALSIARKLGASWAITPKTVDPEVQKGVEALESGIAKTKNAKLSEMLKWGLARFKKQNGADNTAEKLDAVKAFAKAIGLDPSLLGGVTTKKSAPKGSLKDDIDLVRNEMRNVTPELAAMLSAGLDALAKGKDPFAEEEKPDSKSEASGKKSKTVSKDTRKPIIGSAVMALDSAPQAGKAVALSHADFEKEMANIPSDKKIVAISDVHRLYWDDELDIPDDGIVVIAGDISDKLSTSESSERGLADAAKEADKFLTQTFFPFVGKHKKTKFIVIPGNHDHALGSDYASTVKWPENVTFLSDAASDVNGLKVYGTGACTRRPGQPESYFDGKYAKRVFELKDDDLKKRYDAIPDGLDILVVHQPPESNHVGSDFKYGSSYLTDIIKAKKPKLVICGHIHDNDHRPFTIGESVVMNAANAVGRDDRSLSYVKKDKNGKVTKKGNGRTFERHEIGIASNGGFIVDGENTRQLA